MVLAICFAGLLAYWAADRWIVTTVLPRTLAETSVELRDRDGILMRAYPVKNGIWRLAVRLEEVDPTYIEMLLAYEDKRFFSHAGVDPRAMIRAVGQAIWHGRAVSGGSTLTMQVARLLEDGSTGRWAGKLRQIRVALALERHLTKPEILALYLTHAPYGGNLEGVASASYAWFAKPAKRLTAAEAALLVALPQAPVARRPDRFAVAARAARNRVLARVAAQGVISAEVAQAAARVSVPQVRRGFPMLAPHLGDRLRVADPARRRHDTTLDAALQARLQAYVAERVRAQGRRLSAAMMVVDHTTGAVRASVGAGDYLDVTQRGFVDMTQAQRSPGSTLKPLIYGLAFDEGLVHPETLIRDEPVNFGGYAPQNFDGRFRGDVRVREALQMSLNTPVVTLTEALGPARVMAALRQGGLRPSVPGGKPGLAVSLGGLGVSLQELVQLYTVLAAGGEGPRLSESQQYEARRVSLLSPVSAWYLADILRDLPVPDGSTGGDIAYKTGTSYGHRDTWAIGWDGRYVIGVWLGRADGTPVPGAFGAGLAAPILFDAFGMVAPERVPLPPPPPSALVVRSAALPQPLQRYRARQEVYAGQAAAAPQVVFPPDQASLALGGLPVTVKLRGGQAPFSVLANGRPVARGLRSRSVEVASPGPGYASLVVIDAQGLSAEVTVNIVDERLVGPMIGNNVVKTGRSAHP